MSTGLIDIIKRASTEAIESNQPSDLRYGKVVSASPLKVEITNLFTIPQSMLIVPEHLTDHEITVSVTDEYGWTTENESGGGGYGQFDSHSHDIVQSKKKVFIHAALKVGDKVALIRKQGGQSYYVLDRLPN